MRTFSFSGSLFFRRPRPAAAGRLLLTGLTAGALVAGPGRPVSGAPDKKAAAAAGAPAAVVNRPAPAAAAVVRPAPDFIWVGAENHGYPLKKLRGQPVVLLLAPSAESGEFRKQLERCEKVYLQFAAKRAVFIAAFTGPQSPRPASNVPVVMAANGPATGQLYGVGANEFACVVIGPDGNIDLESKRVEGAQRLLNVMANDYPAQAAERLNKP